MTTLSQDIFARAAALRAEGRPFVLATVVWSQKPTSARPGAKGIVTEDGALFGWVGGSCAQPTVVREALQALIDGRARLLRLGPPDAADPRPDVVVAPMTCASGGVVEVFLEPFLPPLTLAVVGASPVADALIRLGHAMGYRVVAARPGEVESVPEEADERLDGLDLAGAIGGRRAAVVVASMGLYDEDAVRRALEAGADYVGLVASRRRFEGLREGLRALGLPDAALARVKAPAGLDIAASAPEEIAVSILAELIARRAALAPAAPAEADRPAPETAVDPVCGMTVEVAGARHTTEHEGRRYYFCAPGCQRAFIADPERYLARA